MAQEARHVQPANDWLIGIADEQLVPFGAMHPDYPDKIGEICRLRAAGIKGIKLHPTDFCLVSQKDDAAVIERLPISTREKERILGENARELIGLS